jgi:hypothetical protein
MGGDDGQVTDNGGSSLAEGRRAHNEQCPSSWRDHCVQRVRKASGIIGLITPAVTIKDWSFKDCQDYLVELEMVTSGALMTLRLANNDFNGSQNDHQITCLTSKAREVKAMTLQLKQRHLNVMLRNDSPSAQVYSSLGPRGAEPRE